MKYLRLFENIAEEPNIDEFLFFEIKNINSPINIIKIISTPIDSKVYPNTFFMKTRELMGYYESDIYYNYKDKYFFYASGVKCDVLFRTFNIDEAFDRLNLIKNSNNFNI